MAGKCTGNVNKLGMWKANTTPITVFKEFFPNGATTAVRKPLALQILLLLCHWVNHVIHMTQSTYRMWLVATGSASGVNICQVTVCNRPDKDNSQTQFSFSLVSIKQNRLHSRDITAYLQETIKCLLCQHK